MYAASPSTNTAGPIKCVQLLSVTIEESAGHLYLLIAKSIEQFSIRDVFLATHTHHGDSADKKLLRRTSFSNCSGTIEMLKVMKGLLL